MIRDLESLAEEWIPPKGTQGGMETGLTKSIKVNNHEKEII